MRAATYIAAVALLLRAVEAVIANNYHSLLWQFDGRNFWTPLGINATTFAMESRTGAALDALNKRPGSGLKGSQFLSCTVMTLDETLGEMLSAEILYAKLNEYRTMGDDVWSEEQV